MRCVMDVKAARGTCQLRFTLADPVRRALLEVAHLVAQSLHGLALLKSDSTLLLRSRSGYYTKAA